MGAESVVKSFQELVDAGVLEIGDGYRAQNVELGGDGPIFLRSAYLTEDGLDLASPDRFKKELFDRIAGKRGRPGDVVVTTKGNSTGRVGYIPCGTPEFVYSPHLSYWRSLNPDRLFPGFLRYWSRHAEFRRQLNAMKASTDMAPYLSLRDQRRLMITVLPIGEQRSIAAILGVLDDKIDLNRRMNRTLEAMAQAIFKSWFIDFDGHTDLAESGLGPIPRGWTICGFPNVVDILGGGTPRNEPDFWDGPIPWVSAKDAAQCSEVFVVQTEKTITKAGEASSSAKVRPAGTTIITARGTVGKTVLLPRPMAFNQSCYGLLPKDGQSTLFTFLLARSLVETLQRQAHGGIFDTITHRTFESLRIVAPPAEAISRFETVVGPLFQRVLLNTEQSLTLAALRDTLLPKLISGEIRVPESAAMMGD
jgi:type I restriction enzyme S subunit